MVSSISSEVRDLVDCREDKQRLVRRGRGAHLERKTVYYVADAPKLLILVAGSGINVDAYAGEGTR